MKQSKYIIFLLISLDFAALQAQNQTAAVLRNKLTAFCNNFPREEIYIHTDRERYVAGETMWFNVYAMERINLKPSSISKIAYVELLNYDNRPVVRKSIYLTGGTGPGEFTLPDTLSSGVYQLRSYSAWMKNFLPGNCFRKEIVIYNAVSTDARMKHPAVSSQVMNSTEPKNFPGFEVAIDNSAADNIEITINTDNSFRASNNNMCNLIIDTRGNISDAEEIRLVVSEVKHLIPKITLIPGVNHFAFVSPGGKLLAEKFIYIPGKKTPVLKIKTGDAFSKREKISLNVEPGSEMVTGVSVSVSPAARDKFPDLYTYMIFGSEYGDMVLQKMKGRNPDSLPVSYVDSILMNTRSNFINWTDILDGKFPEIKFHPETDEHYLSGKLINGTGREERVVMSIPGKKAVFQYSETDAEGNFTFNIPIDGSTREIILEPDDLKGKSVVKLMSPFSEDYLQGGHSSDTMKNDAGEMGISYQVQRIYGITDNEVSNEKLPAAPEVKRFYGKPDIGLKLEDYIKLPTMDEIFFEIIPGTALKKRRTGYEITVSDPVTNLVYDHPPSLFIDGVRIADAEQIANLDPEYVEEIDVMRERYFIGDYMFTGIVNVITKAGDFGSMNLPENAVKTFYKVIDPVKRFISPDHSNDNQLKRIPDFRNTLWWNSSLPAKTTAEFWSSDVPGDYTITVNGITAAGVPVSAEKIILIK